MISVLLMVVSRPKETNIIFIYSISGQHVQNVEKNIFYLSRRVKKINSEIKTPWSAPKRDISYAYLFIIILNHTIYNLNFIFIIVQTKQFIIIFHI